MDKRLKVFLFTLGILVSVMIINAIIFSIVVNYPNTILVVLGTYMWAILPIFIFLVTLKGKSETQKALKKGAIWAFVIMAVIMGLNYLNTVS